MVYFEKIWDIKFFKQFQILKNLNFIKKNLYLKILQIRPLLVYFGPKNRLS